MTDCLAAAISLPDVAALTSACFAAVATVAAWASVWQSRRLQADAIRPYLNGQASQASGGAPIKFAVQNAGMGPARGVGFCVIAGDEYMRGYAAPNMGGLFKPGDRRVLTTEFSGENVTGVTGVVTCKDALGNFHAFNLEDGSVRSWKRSRFWRSKPPEQPEDALLAVFPDLNLDRLTKVRGHGPIE